MHSIACTARLAIGPLLPCPFCGGAATVEADPWRGESVRIACASATCSVAPRTEFLLPCFTDELSTAWNGRLAPAAEDEPRRLRDASGWR